MSDLGVHNAKETTDGWVRHCRCGGEGWPQMEDHKTVAVWCFRCPNFGKPFATSREAIDQWNEQEKP